tara:strand:+ start:822 stop:1124 length:303 start_codon:yes stop_codon:yes gene_type:complete
MATVKLVEIYKQNKFTNTDSEQYQVRPVYVNPEYVICLREDMKTLKMLSEGLLPVGLDSRQEFTRIHISGGQNTFDITVVGSPESVEETLARHRSRLLKG